jgi:type VI secretion system secreted protein Hcp
MGNFLKLEGIVGESKDAGHIGEIEIESVIWGYKKSHFGDDSRPKNRSGKVIGDIRVTKKCDGDSNKLASALASGQRFPNGKITLAAGEDKRGEPRVYTIAMSNVLIASINSDNSTESIELNYDSPT